MRSPMAVLVGIALTTACGSSTSGPTTRTVIDTVIVADTITGDSTLEGFLGHVGVHYNIGPVSTGEGIFLGDADAGANGLSYHAFVGFDLPARVDTGTIQHAVLALTQCAVFGSPFSKLGSVIVDHVDFGATPDTSLYYSTPLAADIGTLSADSTLGTKQLDVAASVANDVTNGRTHSEYRLRFSLLDDNLDGVSDYVYFYTTQTACTPQANALPSLIVTRQRIDTTL
jgi:hypothetical protein